MTTPAGGIEPDPCPFCGETLIRNDNQEDFYVKRYGTHWKHPLDDCYLSDMEISPIEVAAWERRAPIEVLVPRPEPTTKQERGELEIRRAWMSRNPFCPDHRDKVQGLSCRQCEIERLTHLTESQSGAVQGPAIEDRADALRYRWLRHGDNDDKVIRAYQYGNYMLRNEDLDAAIDAAMKEQT